MVEGSRWIRRRGLVLIFDLMRTPARQNKQSSRRFPSLARMHESDLPAEVHAGITTAALTAAAAMQHANHFAGMPYAPSYILAGERQDAASSSAAAHSAQMAQATQAMYLLQPPHVLQQLAAARRMQTDPTLTVMATSAAATAVAATAVAAAAVAAKETAEATATETGSRTPCRILETSFPDRHRRRDQWMMRCCRMINYISKQNSCSPNYVVRSRLKRPRSHRH